MYYLYGYPWYPYYRWSNFFVLRDKSYFRLHLLPTNNFGSTLGRKNSLKFFLNSRKFFITQPVLTHNEPTGAHCGGAVHPTSLQAAHWWPLSITCTLCSICSNVLLIQLTSNPRTLGLALLRRLNLWGPCLYSISIPIMERTVAFKLEFSDFCECFIFLFDLCW